MSLKSTIILIIIPETRMNYVPVTSWRGGTVFTVLVQYLYSVVFVLSVK